MIVGSGIYARGISPGETTKTVTKSYLIVVKNVIRIAQGWYALGRVWNGVFATASLWVMAQHKEEAHA